MNWLQFLLNLLPNPVTFKIPAETIKIPLGGKTFTIAESNGSITISHN